MIVLLCSSVDADAVNERFLFFMRLAAVEVVVGGLVGSFGSCFGAANLHEHENTRFAKIRRRFHFLREINTPAGSAFGIRQK